LPFGGLPATAIPLQLREHRVLARRNRKLAGFLAAGGAGAFERAPVEGTILRSATTSASMLERGTPCAELAMEPPT
jgi:hypothetical protein